MRLAIIAVGATLVAASAWAQNTAPAAPVEPPASADQQTDPLALELKRLRADFRARFVDYDARLAAMSRRIEALEDALAKVDGLETESSSMMMERPTQTTPAETPAAD
ncbi:MAG: hypothetical protein AAGF49_04770 [Pseudomonadota bacterium]